MRPIQTTESPRLGDGCLNCGGFAVETLLALGQQPPSNRYLPVETPGMDFHPFNFGQCLECGVLQCIDPMPVEMVRSRLPGLRYSEPEDHLDALAARLSAMVRPDARIFGVTYNDDSTLARLNRLGHSCIRRLEMTSDLGIDDECAGLETVQGIIDRRLTDELAKKHGTADVIVMRYLLEHAHLPVQIMSALHSLLAPCGLVVVEVPDCRKFIDACDYSFLWEEHVGYYTPKSVKDVMRRAGFQVAETLVYPYALEDALVVIARPGVTVQPAPGGDTLALERGAARRFSREFENVRRQYRTYLRAARALGKRIAIFGAGHLAATFLNVLGVGEYVDCVIDDNPDKAGLSMPGSGVPIVGSARLPDVDLCLLALSPASEVRVLAKHKSFVEAGGQFASIFALSPMAVKLS